MKPEIDLNPLCVQLQRKRRESASSSSSVKKVKKPWWRRAPQQAAPPYTHSGDTITFMELETYYCPFIPKNRCVDTSGPRFRLLMRPLNSSPSGFAAVFVTKAPTEWHFIPLLLVSWPGPLLSLRWGKINCKLPGWANRDMVGKVKKGWVIEMKAETLGVGSLGVAMFICPIWGISGV